MATTENGAISFATTGDPRLDLFFKWVRTTPVDHLNRLLVEAWAIEPLETLRLIFHLRDCRGGKGERAQFYVALRWLTQHHPEELAINLKHLPFYGRYKDFLALLNTKLEIPALQELADQLVADRTALDLGQPISLAAKYAPSEQGHHDRTAKAVPKLCRLMGITKVQYRKEYLRPLRRQLDLVETSMTEGQWDRIDFSQVPSVAFKQYRRAFQRHQPERFEDFLKQVREGKTKLHTGQLQPHEIVRPYFGDSLLSRDDALETIWSEYLANAKRRLTHTETMTQALAMVDVSGSMWGQPLKVAVSLGLLVAELAPKPFHRTFLTFSEQPQLERLVGDSLYEQVNQMSRSDWGFSTNLQKAFKLILSTARMYQTPAEQMPKRLFIFSDMQFDKASNGKTNWDQIKDRYQAEGYQLPQIIFWNLRGNTIDFPIGPDDLERSGLVLLSGFSPDLLELVMTDPQIDPLTLLRKVLDHPRYQRIQLHDNETA